MSNLFGPMFNVLSLFDGMSCGQIALNRAGVPYDKYFASEIDKNAIKVTQHNYPNTIQIGDVTKVSAATLPKISLLMGGSPCQGFSSAGKGLNFDDPRSALFFEFVRLKNELNPKYFLLENVEMKKEWRDIISEYLGVDPVFINSADFSAQNRQRWYWTNIPIIEWEPSNITIEDIIDLEKAPRSPKWEFKNFSSNCGLRQIGYYGTNSQNQRLYCSSGKSPTLTAVSTGGPVLPFIKHEGKIGRASRTMCERLQTIPEGYTESVSRTEAGRMLRNGWTVDVIAHIFKGFPS